MKHLIILFALVLFAISCKHSHEHGPDGHDHGSSDHTEHDVKHHDHNNEHDGHVHDGDSHAEKASFVHTVFFWMKEDLSEDEARFFEEGMEKLGRTPSIHSYRWGKPAGTPRDVVDNSYSYAWIVDFLSTEDQDAYQVDPVHLQFVEDCKGLWTKVQVYDTILE